MKYFSQGLIMFGPKRYLGLSSVTSNSANNDINRANQDSFARIVLSPVVVESALVTVALLHVDCISHCM